ncbi:hypothetical protein B0T11DRAFT_64931 [Plectosphaerella cucumerina]|uniref:Uncharacterized protein n=1 Tax=Plectosphaerella cucumerina TaxID=40658 RepID=A0A8K0TMX2_9PEZI|nr:hypothetical protein B0T11DRAFT_64931 [Plectosphaerella cucumerina]
MAIRPHTDDRSAGWWRDGWMRGGWTAPTEKGCKLSPRQAVVVVGRVTQAELATPWDDTARRMCVRMKVSSDPQIQIFRAGLAAPDSLVADADADRRRSWAPKSPHGPGFGPGVSHLRRLRTRCFPAGEHTKPACLFVPAPASWLCLTPPREPVVWLFVRDLLPGSVTRPRITSKTGLLGVGWSYEPAPLFILSNEKGERHDGTLICSCCWVRAVASCDFLGRLGSLSQQSISLLGESYWIPPNVTSCGFLQVKIWRGGFWPGQSDLQWRLRWRGLGSSSEMAGNV